MTLQPIIIGLMRQLELRRKLICISLHLVGLSLILWAMAKLWMSEATTLSKLGEFLGIISRALVSSTYLMRSRQSDSSLFVITVKRITPSLVPWGTPRFSVCNIHIFLSFLGSLLKQCILFEIFLQFSLPPPYTKLKLGKNSGYTRPTLFVGWGEGGWTCVHWKSPQKRKNVPRLLSMIVDI